MALPDLGNRQALTLSILSGQGEMSGRRLREILAAEEGGKKTGAAFYQMMARLEGSGLVEGWYAEKDHDRPGPLPERHYRITGEGESALAEFRAFIARVLELGVI